MRVPSCLSLSCLLKRRWWEGERVLPPICNTLATVVQLLLWRLVLTRILYSKDRARSLVLATATISLLLSLLLPHSCSRDTEDAARLFESFGRRQARPSQTERQRGKERLPIC